MWIVADRNVMNGVDRILYQRGMFVLKVFLPELSTTLCSAEHAHFLTLFTLVTFKSPSMIHPFCHRLPGRNVQSQSHHRGVVSPWRVHAKTLGKLSLFFTKCRP